MTIPTTAEVKQNLNITDTNDDALIAGFISAATSYAEGFQHLPVDYYSTAVDGVLPPMSAATKQAIILLASHWYESRDAGTGGLFSNTPAAAERTTKAVENLLRLDREWKF